MAKRERAYVLMIAIDQSGHGQFANQALSLVISVDLIQTKYYILDSMTFYWLNLKSWL